MQHEPLYASSVAIPAYDYLRGVYLLWLDGSWGGVLMSLTCVNRSQMLDVVTRFQFEDGAIYSIDIQKIEKTRTLNQNSAIFKWGDMVASVLNDHGVEQVVVIDMLTKRGLEMPWSKESFIECVWRNVQEKMIGHRKTSQLKTHQVSEIYNGLSRFLLQEVKIPEVPEFPSAR